MRFRDNEITCTYVVNSVVNYVLIILRDVWRATHCTRG